MTTLTCIGGVAAERPKRNENVDHDRPTLRYSERAGSCRVATWESKPEGPSSVTNDLLHRARRGRAFLRVALGSPADHTSARDRWEDRSGRSREPSSAEPDERCRVQTFEAEAQRRDVPRDAQEWPHTRHHGVHDHAEKCNDEPEQPSSGRNSLYTRRARRGETVELGSPRPRVACE